MSTEMTFIIGFVAKGERTMRTGVLVEEGDGVGCLKERCRAERA